MTGGVAAFQANSHVRVSAAFWMQRQHQALMSGEGMLLQVLGFIIKLTRELGKKSRLFKAAASVESADPGLFQATLGP